ncbi:MAG: AI-2E family transporter [Bacteroidaceae bacterium]|nr:AI-2E family transporter [Bacteroidaceae bacterium]
MKQNEMTLGRFLRIVVAIVVVAVSYFVLDSLSGVLLPFAVAWLLAYLLHPLVNFVQYKLRFKYRALSIFASFIFIVLLLYCIVVAVVPSMHDEVQAMKNITVEFLNKNIRNSSIPEPVMEFFKEMSDKEGITAFLQSAGESDIFTMCVGRIKTFLLGTLNVVSQLFTLFVIMLYLFFILLDFERMSEGWKPYVPKKWRGVVTKLWNDLVSGMNQYFRGQALVALCVGILFATGFVIIGFPMAIVFGLFIGLLNLVPYLQLLSLAPMVLLSMLKAENTGGDFWLILLSALAVLVVVQLIQDLILVPRIMGKRMNLHPAVILLSLSVWGHLLGVLGMIVALPLTTLILAYLRRYHEIAEVEGYTDGRAIKEAIDSANVTEKENHA